MDRQSLNYSTKNIPIPSRKLYMTKLIEKTELLIKRMRWKALLMGKKRNDQERNSNYGFKSRKCPPQHPDLINFENDLLDMIKNVSFKAVRNNFQDKLRKETSSIKESDKAYIFADKTRNLYQLDKNTYDKLYTENITKSYKKSNSNAYNKINIQAKKIATDLNIADRVECMAQKEAFITLKDHKDDFNVNPKCRLINPAKSELGKVSKVIVENINSKVRDETRVNQWKNTNDVIKWFCDIKDKTNCIFVQFDIEEFYPVISKKLVCQALDHAKQFTNVSPKDVNMIMHARKSLLFANNKVWVKKSGDTSFDVTMGCFDGAEICELVGLYILYLLGNKFGNDNMGLYRDDGLACFHGLDGPSSDRIRKDIVRTFQELGLKITIQTNLKIVNFLDVTMNLLTGTYQPYNKPNDQPLYINKNSNHPPNIIKAIPDNISRRINSISSNKEIFDAAAPYYNKALAASGYTEKIEYIPTTTQTTRRRSRNIIWYNPPYSINVQTNIAKKFLYLITKHFPKEHKLYKAFNRNNIKVSYSCLPNVASIIHAHNKKILYNNQPSNNAGCNCVQKENCPLNGNCLVRSTVYCGKVTNDNENNGSYYIGCTEKTFKDRQYKHRNSFKYESKNNKTELSKYIWDLKKKGVNEPNIKWSVVDRAQAYINGSGRCNLCLTEKYHIITSSSELINKRCEFISKCRHENKYYLMNYKEVPPDMH